MKILLRMIVPGKKCTGCSEMSCSSIIIYHSRATVLIIFPIIKQIIAYQKVHIEQGDTLDLYSDYLFYDGKSEMALAKGNVELIDKETHLYTDTINYDVRNRIARYDDRGG